MHWGLSSNSLQLQASTRAAFWYPSAPPRRRKDAAVPVNRPDVGLEIGPSLASAAGVKQD